MIRKDTTKLLKEWKSFLYENKTKPKFKEGQKVSVKICCESCSKRTKLDVGYSFSSEIQGKDMPDFNKSEDKTVNVVLVKRKGKDKQVPECCVSLEK